MPADGCIVVAEPASKALQGLQHTLARPLQPQIEVLGLPLAHELCKVLCQVDRLGDLDRLHVELGELLDLGRGALRLTPQHQPGCPARRERLACRLNHDRERWAPALPSGCQALRLPQAARIGGHAAIAPGVAPRLDLTKQYQECHITPFSSRRSGSQIIE